MLSCGLWQIFRLRFGFRVRRQACRLAAEFGRVGFCGWRFLLWRLEAFPRFKMVASVLDGGRLLFSLGNAVWYSAGLSFANFFAWRRRTRELKRELRCRCLELRFLWGLRKILVWLCGKLGEEPGYGFLRLRNGAPLRKRAGISEAWNFESGCEFWAVRPAESRRLVQFSQAATAVLDWSLVSRRAASRMLSCGLWQIFRLRFGFRVRRQACRWLRSFEGSVASVLDGGRLLFSLGNAVWYSAGLSFANFFAWRRRTREASRELRCRYLELRFRAFGKFWFGFVESLARSAVTDFCA